MLKPRSDFVIECKKFEAILSYKFKIYKKSIWYKIQNKEFMKITRPRQEIESMEHKKVEQLEYTK